MQGFPIPWNLRLIIPIFQNGDKNNPSNYETILFTPLLAKPCGIVLEKKINVWFEIQGKGDNGHVGFRRIHSITYHLIMLRIIA